MTCTKNILFLILYCTNTANNILYIKLHVLLYIKNDIVTACLTLYGQELYIFLSMVSPTLNTSLGLSRSSGNTFSYSYSYSS